MAHALKRCMVYNMCLCESSVNVMGSYIYNLRCFDNAFQLICCPCILTGALATCLITTPYASCAYCCLTPNVDYVRDRNGYLIPVKKKKPQPKPPTQDMR